MIERLIVPPDGFRGTQFGELLDRKPVGVDVGVGEIEARREVRCRHKFLLDSCLPTAAVSKMVAARVRIA
jgi:hypothetical protein